MPPDWMRFRSQWEYAHSARAVIEIAGFSALVLSLLVETPESAAVKEIV